MHIFKVVFMNQGKVYELYAKSVNQGDLFGFVEIGDLVFEHSSQVLVDPSEEKLRTEFQGVRRILVPLHAVIRIDEVEKQGKSKILEIDAKGNVTPFPSPIYAPEKNSDR